MPGNNNNNSRSARAAARNLVNPDEPKRPRAPPKAKKAQKGNTTNTPQDTNITQDTNIPQVPDQGEGGNAALAMVGMSLQPNEVAEEVTKDPKEVAEEVTKDPKEVAEEVSNEDPKEVAEEVSNEDPKEAPKEAKDGAQAPPNMSHEERVILALKKDEITLPGTWETYVNGYAVLTADQIESVHTLLKDEKSIPIITERVKEMWQTKIRPDGDVVDCKGLVRGLMLEHGMPYKLNTKGGKTDDHKTTMGAMKTIMDTKMWAKEKGVIRVEKREEKLVFVIKIESPLPFESYVLDGCKATMDGDGRYTLEVPVIKEKMVDHIAFLLSITIRSVVGGMVTPGNFVPFFRDMAKVLFSGDDYKRVNIFLSTQEGVEYMFKLAQLVGKNTCTNATVVKQRISLLAEKHAIFKCAMAFNAMDMKALLKEVEDALSLFQDIPVELKRMGDEECMKKLAELVSSIVYNQDIKTRMDRAMFFASSVKKAINEGSVDGLLVTSSPDMFVQLLSLHVVDTEAFETLILYCMKSLGKENKLSDDLVPFFGDVHGALVERVASALEMGEETPTYDELFKLESGGFELPTFTKAASLAICESNRCSDFIRSVGFSEGLVKRMKRMEEQAKTSEGKKARKSKASQGPDASGVPVMKQRLDELMSKSTLSTAEAAEMLELQTELLAHFNPEPKAKKAKKEDAGASGAEPKAKKPKRKDAGASGAEPKAKKAKKEDAGASGAKEADEAKEGQATEGHGMTRRSSKPGPSDQGEKPDQPAPRSSGEAGVIPSEDGEGGQ